MEDFIPQIVVFACENSGMKAAEEAKKHGMSIPESINLVSLPCGGRLDTVHILKSFEQGSDGVVVLVCHKDNCRYLYGSEYAEQRVNELKHMLEGIGITGDRVIMNHLAAVEPVKYLEIIQDAYDKIKKLGSVRIKES